MTKVEQFWEAIDDVPPSVRHFLEITGFVSRYLNSEDDKTRSEVIRRARRIIECLSACQLLPGNGANSIEEHAPTDGQGEPDGRWPLLAELGNRIIAETSEGVVVAPLTFASRTLDLGIVPSCSERIEVSFDNRLSLDALIRQLRSVWPELNKRGWLRRTRPWGARKLALVRFVCLESPRSDTWRKRLETWNMRYPDWAYLSPQAIASDFHKAEQSLTGQSDGLGWFYDEARQSVYGRTLGELLDALAADELSAGERKAVDDMLRNIGTTISKAASKRMGTSEDG
ncbi:MAG: hypothetical protein HGA39_05905 [Coriobacteriia bacterium]|nr:hypothetical protein [Coriobacteriia bacterium]